MPNAILFLLELLLLDRSFFLFDCSIATSLAERKPNPPLSGMYKIFYVKVSFYVRYIGDKSYMYIFE